MLADDPIVGPLVMKFVKNMPARMASIHSAQLRSDWHEVANHAHQMSGAAGGYGFPEIGLVAARIEAEARSNPNPLNLARTIRTFDQLCDKVIQGN